MDNQILLSSTPGEPLRSTHTKQCSHTPVILDLDSSPKSSIDLSSIQQTLDLTPESNVPLRVKSLHNILKETNLTGTTNSVPKYPLPTCFLVSKTGIIEPTSFREASKDQNWINAMDSKYNALIQNNTWKLVPRSNDQHIIGCKWVYKLKLNSKGNIDRYKARLVAKGYNQQEGFDFNETFSPVIKHTTIRLLLSIGISRNWHIHQIDISNAFLHGDLEEKVFMEQPTGYKDSKFPDFVCQLQKSLYGLKQAPRAWFHKLTAHLQYLGYVGSKTDTSLFFKWESGVPIFILIYVDDILILSPDLQEINKLLCHLKTKFSVRDLGPAHFFLGIEMIPQNHGFLLSQSKYIASVLTRASMDNCKPISTPLSTSNTPSNDSSQLDNTLFRSLVGSLQYITLTRPDISFAVNQVCQKMHLPQAEDWVNLKRLLRYLKGTISHGLLIYKKSEFSLNAFSDSDWGGCSQTRRSTGGYLIYIGKNLVSWSSKRQPTISRSSTEAEYKSVANAAAEVLWIQSLLSEIHLPLNSSPNLWCDNIGATYLATNPVFHARTKHIEIDFHFVREQVAAKNLKISFIKGEDQLADILTKPLATDCFQRIKFNLNVVPPIEIVGGYQGYAGRSVNSWPDSCESSAAARPNRGETSAAEIY